MVERTNSWVRALEFAAETVALYGTDDNAGAELTASSDSRLDELLHTEFRPAADRVQLDLFLDTSETTAVNAVVDALAMRDAATAEARLHQLAKLNPSHWSINEATALIQALRTPAPEDHAQAVARLDTMERNWLPAACAILHARARDFLTPLWRDLGQGLEGLLFDPTQPRSHASWAYLKGHDWKNVQRTVHAVPDYHDEPLLLRRLAEAEWRLRNRRSAMMLWFNLCWQAPEHFEEVIEAADFPDAMLKKAWHAAQDDDLEPPITTVWFPAWVALVEPRSVRSSTLHNGESPPERAFDLLRALAVGGSDRRDMDNRKALQAVHPGLLQRYLESLDT